MAFLQRLLNKKDTLDGLKDVTINLEFLAEAEARIAEFYRLCAAAMSKEEALWNSLAEAELRHADNARKMIGLIVKEPQLYKPGISFSTASIRMFSLEMQQLVEQMNAGRISPDRLLAIAFEIEDSTVELSYHKIAKTKDETFNALARQIDQESLGHKAALSSRLKTASTS